MDGWTELTRIPVIRQPKDVNTTPPSSTVCAFDEVSDLVWVGDSTGYIGSYAENSLTPYTRFQAHLNPVIQILTHAKGVLSTDGSSLRFTSRRGLIIFKVDEKTHQDLKNIKKFNYISPNELLIATNKSLLRFNLQKAVVTSTIPYIGEVILMASNKRHIALGTSDGSIDIFDPKTNMIGTTFKTNCETLSDIDLKENTLVACGYSRHHGNFSFDPLVNVYDLRANRAMSPIPFPAGAAFVRLHPKLPSVVFIASSIGQIQVIDLSNPTEISLYQADFGPMISSFELCSTGDYLGMLDAYSLLHLWAHSPEFAKMSNHTPLEYPLLLEKNQIPIDIDNDEVPLNSVGLPYYKETLLSAWNAQAVFGSAGTVTNQIDPVIYQYSKIINGLRVAPYDKDKYGRRNQAKKYVQLERPKTLKNFLSSKNTNSSNASKLNSTKNNENDDICQLINEKNPNLVPNAFKKLEIAYSRFGVDDFDFDLFNETRFSGLETHVDNSYTNSLLQVYRFVPEVHAFSIENLANENFDPASILRELGYLYDMLYKSKGKNFRPSNFQHTLSNIPEADKLGLIDRENKRDLQSNHTGISRTQLFHRYFLDKLANDELKVKIPINQNVYFDQIVAIEVETITRSLFTGAYKRNINITRTLEVFSPLANSLKPLLKNSNQPSIVSYIESSMNRVEQNRLLNEMTGQFEVFEISNTVKSLPPVLSINLHLKSEEKKSIRNSKNWLKPKFHAANSKNGFILTDNTRSSLQATDFFKEYELIGFVAEISADSNSETHLVSFVKVFDELESSFTWYLFNDFLVTKIPESEALNLSYWWKTPVSLVYRLNNFNSPQSERDSYRTWASGLNDAILYRDHFSNAIRESRKIEYEKLTREEAPKPGSLIAIDAEFVTLEEEQFEIKANGTRSFLKPSNQTLARVSVLRGDDGDKFGVPFIDDYVVVNEEGIHDYLTSYSGIVPGDLDPRTSNKSLVTREVAYRKLWLLLNLGCVFVGHGLIKDFRTINICVPKDQVRDTAIFFKKGQRILSLRFLAYVLLDKRVQTHDHDSIEDAHTALLLYKEYLKIKESGDFDEVLDYIYSEGQALKFKPPGKD